MERHVRGRLAFALFVMLYSLICIGLFAVTDIPVVLKMILLSLLFLLWTAFACAPYSGCFLPSNVVSMPRIAPVVPTEAATASVDTLPLYEPPLPPYAVIKSNRIGDEAQA